MNETPSPLGRTALITLAAVLYAGVLSCSSREPSTTVGGASGATGAAGEGSGPPDNFYQGCDSGRFLCRGGSAVPCEPADPTPARDCAAEGGQCREPYGCVICTPGEGSCAGGRARMCNAQGTAFEEFECDALQGMVCQADGCTGACSPATLGDGYVGCDYYPTVTPNPVYSGFHFAVAVSNSGDSAASVVVTRGAEAIAQRTVAPGELSMI